MKLKSLIILAIPFFSNFGYAGTQNWKIAIDLQVRNSKCVHSGTAVGLGDILELHAKLFTVDSVSGAEIPKDDLGKQIIWTMEEQATPSYPASQWSDSRPVGGLLEFGIAQGSSFVGQSLTITASEPTSGAIAQLQLRVAADSLSACD